MKQIITIILALLCYTNGVGQATASFETDTIVIEREKNITQTFPIAVNVTWPAAAGPTVLTFAINVVAVNQLPAAEYQFAPLTISVFPPTLKTQFSITISGGTSPDGKPQYICLQVTPAGNPHKHVIIKVMDKKQPEKESKDDTNVSLLIGSNLDFFNTVKLKDLAAEFNVFVPKIFSLSFSKKKATARFNVGANMGIYNYRNFTIDSPGRPVLMNYKLVPYETLDGTKKIVKATYNTKGKVIKDFQGFYIEPLISLGRTEKRDMRMYLSLHLEILRRTERTELENPNYLSRDTLFYDASRDFDVKERPFIFDSTKPVVYHSAFWGIGLPVVINKKYFSLSFTPTWGFAQLQELEDPKTNELRKTWNAFYLCRFFFRENVSLLGLTLGGEVRGIFGKLNPYLNAYVASRIKLDKLSDFFKKD